MKIINLIENTPGASGCGVEHGLSFYIETARHKLLMDTGQTDLLLSNAARLGIDLTQVDTVVVSHGHYDHGGGLEAFLKINEKAKVYIQSSAREPHYKKIAEEDEKYIGLSEEVSQSPRITWLEGDETIDEELSLFAGIGTPFPVPVTNRALKAKREGALVQDDFGHEQCLVICEEGNLLLLSGCAHHGMPNVLARFRQIYEKDPDYVISGFHLMDRRGYQEEQIRDIVRMARDLTACRTRFYTCHCTGTEPFEVMKKIMGDQLEYVHCGDEVHLRKWEPKNEAGEKKESKEGKKAAEGKATGERATEAKTGRGKAAGNDPKERRKQGMKWHRFFAWATVFCFVMTMVTGYKHK